VNDGNYRHSVAVMGTIVTIQVAGRIPDQQTVERAFEWFYEIERRCTRFEAQSELMQLSRRIGTPVPVSAILFEAVQFALAVAEESGGALDPTVGYSMETRGFNKEHRSGQVIQSTVKPNGRVNYKDVRLDPDQRTVTLLKPLVLDLGAVAKGLAIDMAARELRTLRDFAIDAGGDLYLGGVNPNGSPWSIGIRHPRRDAEWIEALNVTDRAVCTSGDYERSDHILDPRTGTPANSVASVTVVAPTAMMADGLATAAFVLGPTDGIQLLNRMGVGGIIFSTTLERFATGYISS